MTMASNSGRLSAAAKKSRPYSMQAPVQQGVRSAAARNLIDIPYNPSTKKRATETTPSMGTVPNFATLQPSQRQHLVQSMLSALRDVSTPIRDASRIPLFHTRPEQDAMPMQPKCLENSMSPPPTEQRPAHTDQTAWVPSLVPDPHLLPCRRFFHSPFTKSKCTAEENLFPCKSLGNLQGAKDIRLFSRGPLVNGSNRVRDAAPCQPACDKRSFRPSTLTVTDSKLHPSSAPLSASASRQETHEGGLLNSPAATVPAAGSSSRAHPRPDGPLACRIGCAEVTLLDETTPQIGRKRHRSGEGSPSAPSSEQQAKHRRVLSPPGRSRDWMCDICLVHNSSLVTSCSACGLVRPDAIPPLRAELKSDGSELIKLRQSMAASLWSNSSARPTAGSSLDALPGSRVNSKALTDAVQVMDSGSALLGQVSNPVAPGAAARPTLLSEVPSATEFAPPSIGHKAPAALQQLPDSTPAAAAASGLNFTSGPPKRILFKFGDDANQASTTASEVAGTLPDSVVGASVKAVMGQESEPSSQSSGFLVQPGSLTFQGLSAASAGPAAIASTTLPLVSSTEMQQLAPATSSAFSFGSALPQSAVSKSFTGAVSATSLHQPGGFSLAATPTSNTGLFSFGNPAVASSTQCSTVQPAFFGAAGAIPAASGSAAVKRTSSASKDDLDGPGAKKTTGSALGASFGSVSAQGHASHFQVASAPRLGSVPLNQSQAVDGFPAGSTPLASNFRSFANVQTSATAPAPPALASGGFALAPALSFNFGGTAGSSGGLFRFGAPQTEATQAGAMLAGGAVPEAAPASAFQFGAAGSGIAAASVPAFGYTAESNVFTSGTRVMKKATRRLGRK